jgi:hypothetical protein
MSKGKYSCYNIVYRSVTTMHKIVLQLCIIVSKRAYNCSNDVYNFFVIISATSTFTLTHWLHQDLKYTAASNAKQVMEVVDVTCVSHHWPRTPNGEESSNHPTSQQRHIKRVLSDTETLKWQRKRHRNIFYHAQKHYSGMKRHVNMFVGTTMYRIVYNNV